MDTYRHVRVLAFVAGMMISIPATVAQSVPDEEALVKKAKALVVGNHCGGGGLGVHSRFMIWIRRVQLWCRERFHRGP